MRILRSRRSFLSACAASAAAVALRPQSLEAAALWSAGAADLAKAPLFANSDPAWQRTWDAAIAVLARNVRAVPGYAGQVLFEGSAYQGIWQECGPHEGLVYATVLRARRARESVGGRTIPGEAMPGPITPMEVARNNHMAFFALQQPDGQLPASIKMDGAGFGQIQMVVPIAATAWELARMTGDEELLVAAYNACSRWDAWLRRYRNTRGTGLVEGFCTYDTGTDNSPRWAGIPNRCPDGDARRCPKIASLPRLCPDLSATVYGGRIALANMAAELGKTNEADRWREDAESLRRLIVEKLYCPEDAAFYDLDAQNRFVRVRSVVNSRVLGEHVLQLSNAPERVIFDDLWNRQLHNPKAFWAAYPLTSIAQDDPDFVRPIPRNSWGGASQALTALRAPRWMAHYGKQAALDELMRQWCRAIMRHTEFCQQVDPLTGDFTQPDPGGYSPAALVFLDFVLRGRRELTPA